MCLFPTCVHVCACVCTDGPASALKLRWARLYESRQCARGEQGSEKDVAAAGGVRREHQAEGPPSRRQFD